MLSVSITTSTEIVGAAVGSVDSTACEVLAFEELVTQRRHAEEIIPLIEKVLNQAEVDKNKIEALIIDVGPGRFTGLRVGVSTVVGLALALEIPTIPISSLEILAARAIAENNIVDSVTAVIDARRSEVFQQRFDLSGKPINEPETGDPELLFSENTLGLFVGDGVDKYREVYGSSGLLGQTPSAEVMLKISVGKKTQNAAGLRPMYLREPDAVANIKTRLNE